MPNWIIEVQIFIYEAINTRCRKFKPIKTGLFLYIFSEFKEFFRGLLKALILMIKNKKFFDVLLYVLITTVLLPAMIYVMYKVFMFHKRFPELYI